MKCPERRDGVQQLTLRELAHRKITLGIRATQTTLSRVPPHRIHFCGGQAAASHEYKPPGSMDAEKGQTAPKADAAPAHAMHRNRQASQSAISWVHITAQARSDGTYPMA